jgi:hypothetical protein
MVELGKIEKPEASSFKSKRKIYVIPTLPFEDLAVEFNIDKTKIERFWGEVREKISYFISTYGKTSVVYVEGIEESEKVGIEYFEKFGKDSNHYKLIKTLVDSGAVIKGIDKKESIKLSKLLFEEYSKSFLPEIKDLHQDFFGKDIDFDKWREYLVKRIQETQEEMNKYASGIITEQPDNSNCVLIITEGRPVDYPQGMEVFMIRPPAFDEIAKNMRDIQGR